jgi:hypothetical protein
MVCCNLDENFKTIEVNSCGTRQTIGAGFYLKATKNNAQFAEFNWMTSVEEGSNKICSGSLIDKNLVITSAACVNGKNANSLKVRLGSWKTHSQEAKPDTEEVHQVDKIILKSNPNVALLVLKTSAELNMYINTACLPFSDQTFEEKSCIVVGWGYDKLPSEDLKKSFVKVVSCQDAFGISLKVPGKTICAQLDKKVETGASLVCLIDETEQNYQIAGIALPNPSQLDSTPTVFIDASYIRDWVDEKVNEIEGDLNSYSYSHASGRWFYYNPYVFQMYNFPRDKCKVVQDVGQYHSSYSEVCSW